MGGTVDGRDVSVDGTKLDNIEDGATGDLTAAEIEALLDAYYGSTDWRGSALPGASLGSNSTDGFASGGNPLTDVVQKFDLQTSAIIAGHGTLSETRYGSFGHSSPTVAFYVELIPLGILRR